MANTGAALTAAPGIAPRVDGSFSLSHGINCIRIFADRIVRQESR